MWGLSRRVVSPKYVKNIGQTSTDIKKLAPKLEPFKKLIFWVPIFRGVPASVAAKKIRQTKLRLQLNNFTLKLNFNVLWFRRRRVYKI